MSNVKAPHQHEALGFRIALSHTLRKLGSINAAERNLEKVQEDIVAFGASERTFLSYLLEAGRILNAKNRFIRAYWVYLLPAYRRAKSRGMIFMAERIRGYAINSLNRAIEEKEQIELSEDWRKYIQEQISISDALTDIPNTQHPSDPGEAMDHIGYLAKPENLYTKEGLRRELSFLSGSVADRGEILR